MDCLNPYCENEVAGDYPFCSICAPTRHFEYREDCKCEECQSDAILYPVWFDLAGVEAA